MSANEVIFPDDETLSRLEAIEPGSSKKVAELYTQSIELKVKRVHAAYMAQRQGRLLWLMGAAMVLYVVFGGFLLFYFEYKGGSSLDRLLEDVSTKTAPSVSSSLRDFVANSNRTVVEWSGGTPPPEMSEAITQLSGCMANLEASLKLDQSAVLNLASIRNDIADLQSSLDLQVAQVRREVDTVYNIFSGIGAGLILAFVSVVLGSALSRRGSDK